VNTVDYTGLVKSLRVPPGFTPPTELAYSDIRARVLSRADLQEDVRGINASIETHPTHPWWRMADRTGHGRGQLRRPRLARAGVS